jgi:hypothetical protein
MRDLAYLGFNEDIQRAMYLLVVQCDHQSFHRFISSEPSAFLFHSIDRAI